MCLQIVVWIVFEMAKSSIVEFDPFFFWNGKEKKKCILSIETYGVICMSNLTFWFCVMYHSYNVTSQLGPCLWHTLDDGACMCVVINGDQQSPLKFVQKRFFHLKVCQGHLYTHCIITPPFPSKVISCGLFMGYYYMGTINKFIWNGWSIITKFHPTSFVVLNGDKTWNDWNEFYLETSGPCYLSHA